MGYINVDLSALEKLPPPGTLRVQASLLAAAGMGFAESVEDTAGKWQALEGLYETPHKHLVLNALAAPAHQATGLAESTDSVAAAIRSFADAVDTIRAATNSLRSDIAAADRQLGAILEEPVPGIGDDFSNSLIRYQWDFEDRASKLASDYQEARDVCLKALSAVGRASTDVNSYYGSNRLDLLSHEAERLHRLALSPDAAPEDVQAYYNQLAGMDAGRYREFAADYPEAAVFPPRVGLAAEHQAAFWHSLSPEQQAALAESLPAVAGNTEGVPYTVRAAANAAVLALVMKPAWRATEEQRRSYAAIEESLEKTGSKAADRSLISFDPAEPPLAAVAIGNMDTATSITANISGMGSSTQDMGGAVRVAENLYNEQRRLGADPAVLAWIGYDAPDMPPSTEVLFSDKARTGGAKLATVIDGFYYTRSAENPPFISVTAHSYGTTTAAYALSQTENTIDSLVFYGSAGIDPEAAESAADLKVRSGEVYATLGRADKVAPAGQLGSNFGDPRVTPTSETWGAKVFSSEPAVVDGRELLGNGGHGGEGSTVGAGITETEKGRGYLDPDTASLRHIAAASSGSGERIGLIPEAETDAALGRLADRGSAVYYAPGRAVDSVQDGAAAFADGAQASVNRAADTVQGGLMFAADTLQEQHLRDVGPFRNPLNPLVDGLQGIALEKTDALQEQFNNAMDGAQSTVDTIIDAHQKAADEYFKRKWRAFEFVAGKLVALQGSD